MKIKDEVKELKRKRILEVAAELFSRKGYPSTTLDDIALELEVTKPFIYSYFSSKSELLSATFIRTVQLCLETIDAHSDPAISATDRLSSVTKQTIAIAAENHVYSTIFLGEQKNVDRKTLEAVRVMEAEWHRKIELILDQGVQSGEFQVADTALAALVIGGQIAWIYSARESVASLDVKYVQDQISLLVLRMVGVGRAV